MSHKVSRSLVRPFIGDVPRLKVSKALASPRSTVSRPQRNQRIETTEAYSVLYRDLLSFSLSLSLCPLVRVRARVSSSSPSMGRWLSPCLVTPFNPPDRVANWPITLIEKKRPARKIEFPSCSSPGKTGQGRGRHEYRLVLIATQFGLQLLILARPGLRCLSAEVDARLTLFADASSA